MELRRRKSHTWLSLNDANENGISLMELVPGSTGDAEEMVCLEGTVTIVDSVYFSASAEAPNC
jgi:hypothetical protein